MDNTAVLATHIDGQVRMNDDGPGKEVNVNVANTHFQERRAPKVTFRCPEVLPYYEQGPCHYAKIFLPKTYEDAEMAAIRCFRELLIHPNFSKQAGKPITHLELMVSIKKNDEQGFAWARILHDEWWAIMIELIEENPDLEVSVVAFRD